MTDIYKAAEQALNDAENLLNMVETNTTTDPRYMTYQALQHLKVVRAALAQKQELLTDVQKLDIVMNWFSEESDISKAMQVLTDFEQTSPAPQPVVQEPWQPIETAPKDGRVIVVRHNRGTWIHPKDQDNACCVCVFWGGRSWSQFGPDVFDDKQLTHWMPLPSEPSAAPQPAVQHSDIACDRAYRNGLQAGYRLGETGDESGYQSAMGAYQREITSALAELDRRPRAPQPAVQEGGTNV